MTEQAKAKRDEDAGGDVGYKFGFDAGYAESQERIKQLEAENAGLKSKLLAHQDGKDCINCGKESETNTVTYTENGITIDVLGRKCNFCEMEWFTGREISRMDKAINRELEQENAALKAENADLRKYCTQLENDRISLENHGNNVGIKCINLEAENAELKQTLNAENDRLERNYKLEKENAALKSRVEKLRASLIAEYKAYQDLELQLQGASINIDELRAEVKRLENLLEGR